MLKYFFIALYYFGGAIIHFKFSKKHREQLYLSGKLLLTEPSFRLPKSANNDPFIVIRQFKRTLWNMHTSATPVKELGNCQVAILDGSFKYVELETEYIERQSDDRIGYFIAKEALQFQSSIIDKFLLATLLVPLVAFIFPLSLMSVNRANYALLISEITEAASLLKIVRRFTIKKIYDFIPFEKDSGILAYILMKKGIAITKLPSPGPLSTHNKVIIADQLIISTKYQNEELKLDDIRNFASLTLMWLPEYSFQYINLYVGKKPSPPLNMIGLYSHGSWLRREGEDQDNPLFSIEAEDKLIEYLNGYLLKNPEIKLIIYPHPREKHHSIAKKTMEYYNSCFPSLEFEIFWEARGTSTVFNQVDLAITTYSTIMMERLFCGFKGLFFTEYFKFFPVHGSSMQNICIPDGEQVFQFLDRNIQYTAEEFFIENQLNGYRYFEYDYFKGAMVK